MRLVRQILVTAALCAAASLAVLIASVPGMRSAAVSGTAELANWGFDTGGGESSSDSYGAGWTTGELALGEATSENFGAQGGFRAASLCFDDNDGLEDAAEAALGTSTCAFDSDVDGLGDGGDNCPITPNATQANFDGDPMGDVCDNDDDGDGYHDPDETLKGSQVLNAVSTPEHCDGVDNDGDTVFDEAPAMSGRATPDPLCTSGAGAGADPDGDTITNAADLDDDGDGFTDVNERYMSTDELDDCRVVAGHDAWPPDFNKSTRVDVIDALFFGSPILSGEYDRRFDLNGNGAVNIIDVLVLGPFMMQSCSNP